MFTRASVDCADRIVATSSSNGVAVVQLGVGVRDAASRACRGSRARLAGGLHGRPRATSVHRCLCSSRRCCTTPRRRASVPAARRSGSGTNCTGTTILRAHRRAHDVLGARRRVDLLLGERHHLAEGEREVERRVRDRAEVRVGARRRRASSSGTMVKLICLGWSAMRSVTRSGDRVIRARWSRSGRRQYFRITPTTTP